MLYSLIIITYVTTNITISMNSMKITLITTTAETYLTQNQHELLSQLKKKLFKKRTCN